MPEYTQETASAVSYFPSKIVSRVSTLLFVVTSTPFTLMERSVSSSVFCRFPHAQSAAQIASATSRAIAFFIFSSSYSASTMVSTPFSR